MEPWSSTNGQALLFLCADIEEDVFVEMAPGYETKSKEGLQLMMKLEKSLYGLAQSPQNWWKTIDPSLVEIGFVSAQVRHLRLHLRPQQHGRRVVRHDDV
ncbi:unnamed protein product [Ectocarpus sp. 4 AP-2014]